MGLLEFKIAQPRLADALDLPELPDDLIEAERAHAEIAADLAVTRADFQTLNMDFDVVELRRADGSMFPTSNREALLVKLFRRCAELEVSKDHARRVLDDARRSFSETASKAIAPAADTVCEAAIEHIDAAIILIETLEAMNTKASKSGLTLGHKQIARASGLGRQLYEMRRQLAPVPTGGRR